MSEHDSPPPERTAWLRGVLALFTLLLMFVTWPLWSASTELPRVPLLAAFGALAGAHWLVEPVVLAAAIACLAAAALFCWNGQWRWLGLRASEGAAGSLLVLMLMNQHRVQPWAYLTVVALVLLARFPAAAAERWLRGLVVSLYAWSAWSKLDATFIDPDGLGPVFVATLLAPLAIDVSAWPAALRTAAACLLPVGELLVAGMLLARRARKSGVVAAIAMHLSLAWIVGPGGLGHAPGVLVWNLLFIVLTPLLFWPAAGEGGRRSSDAPPMSLPERWRQRLVAEVRQLPRNWATPLVLVVLMLPLGADFGLCDEWPAWGLYATRAERTHLELPAAAAERLPPELRRHLLAAGEIEERQAAGDGVAWRRLRLDRWSLDAVAAPLYPQNRFQLGVAEAVVRRHRLAGSYRIVVQSRAGRFTGRRETTILRRQREIDDFRRRYWLNSAPLEPSPEPPVAARRP